MTSIEELLDVVTPDMAQPPAAESIRTLIARRRVRRRTAGLAAVFLLITAGSMFVIAQRFGIGGDDSLRIESVEDPEEIDETEDVDGEQSLVVSEVDSTGLPGEIGQLISVGQRFFMLDGSAGESTRFRRDVGYIYDGVSWKEGAVGGRSITSEIQSDSDGTLFVLSETFGSGLPELGRSYDGGATWDWLAIEADFEPFYDAVSSLGLLDAPRVVSRDGVQLVVLSRPAMPGHAEARALIKAAIGVDIDDMGNEASFGNATLEGVELMRVPNSAVLRTACDTALSQAWNDSGLFGGSVPGVEPSPVGDLFGPVQDVNGCRERAECALLVAGRQAAGAALASHVRESSVPYRAANALIEQRPKQLACEEELDVYGRGFDAPIAETELITWEEMGVDVPDTWRGEVVGVLVEGSTITDLGELFPLDNKVVVGARSGPDGFSIVTSVLELGGQGTEAGMVWSSGPEHESWSSRPISPDEPIWSGTDPRAFEPVAVDDGTFWVDYSADLSTAADQSDPEALLRSLRSKLVRRGDDGSVTEWALADIAPELEGTYILTEFAAGQLGLAVVAEPLSSTSSAAAVLLVSKDDGLTWNESNVDGFVHQIAVGSDAIMLAVSGSPNHGEQPVSFVVATFE